MILTDADLQQRWHKLKYKESYCVMVFTDLAVQHQDKQCFPKADGQRRHSKVISAESISLLSHYLLSVNLNQKITPNKQKGGMVSHSM